MGRPPRALLTREQIAATALELLDQEGPSGLGMRRLARRMGVQAPSLYHHVSGQEEIIDLVHELVDNEIDISTLVDPDWRRGLNLFARSYRRAFLRHPHAVALVTRRTIHADNVLALYDSVAALLLRAGMPAPQTLPTLAAIDFIVLGSTVDDFDAGFGDFGEDLRRDYPHLAGALDATDRETVNDRAFEAALELLLDDIAARLDLAAARPVVTRSR